MCLIKFILNNFGLKKEIVLYKRGIISEPFKNLIYLVCHVLGIILCINISQTQTCLHVIIKEKICILTYERKNLLGKDKTTHQLIFNVRPLRHAVVVIMRRKGKTVLFTRPLGIQKLFLWLMI